MHTGGPPDCGLCVALDVQDLSTGGARAAAALAAGAAFAPVLAGRTAAVPRAAPGRPGVFSARESPPPRAALAGLSGPGLLAAGGYADRDPDGRPGLGAPVHAESGIPVTGVATSRFRTATRPVPVQRGSPVCPLFVTAAGMPAADAADLARRMAGRYRLPGALRRADTPRASRSDRSHHDRPPVSYDIEDSAAHVADLRRGICIVNLRSAESPVCPFRWPQSAHSRHRSLPARALG